MEEKSCTVIVPNNQLSLAIGNKGQNAKLAAKLTGFKIDIKPQFDTLTNEEAPELSPDFVAPVFEAAPPEDETEEIAPENVESAEAAPTEAEDTEEATADEE
jgi:N utilization substance protein A